MSDDKRKDPQEPDNENDGPSSGNKHKGIKNKKDKMVKKSYNKGV